MSATALLEAIVSEPGDEDMRLWSDPGEAAMLADVIAIAWAGLSAGAPVACPVCDGPMRPRHAAGAGVVGGRCDDCGAELS